MVASVNERTTPTTETAVAQNAWSSALATLGKGWRDRNGGFNDNSPSEVSNAVAEIQSAGPLLAETESLLAA
jgi:hypothetical protein